MRRKTSKTLVRDYLRWCRDEKGMTKRTLYTYMVAYDAFLDVLDTVHVLDAEVDDLRRYLLRPAQRTWKGEARGRMPSESTRKRRVAELRGLYRWLQVEGYRLNNPAGRLVAPTVHNEAPKPFPVKPWQSLWTSDLSDSDRVAFGLGMFCGLRRAEVTGLAPWHVVWQPRQVLVDVRRKGGVLKTMPWRSCVRYFDQHINHLIGDELTFVDPLRRLVADRRNKPTLLDWEEHINPRLARRQQSQRKHRRPDGMIDPQTFGRRLRAALRACGEDPDAGTPHMLRHGFCSYLLRAGVPLIDVSRLANHSSVEITQRYIESAEDPLEALLAGGDIDDDDGDEFNPFVD